MKFLMLLAFIFLLIPAEAEDHIDALYTQEDRIAYTDKMGTVKKLYPAEMCAVLKAFHRALVAKDYDKALSFCSREMVTKSREFDSADSFFKTYFAIDNVLALKESPMQGAYTREGKAPTGMYCSMRIEGFQWIWKINLVNETWVISFETKEPFEEWREANRIYKEKRDAVMKEREAALVAKIPGISTVLEPLHKTYKLGQPILLVLELKHDGPGTLHYDDQQVRVNGSLTVKDSKGNTVKYSAGPFQTIGGYRPIKPGQRINLLDGFDLSSQYTIKESGTYTVQFNGRGLHVGHQYKLEQFEKDYLKRLGHFHWFDPRVYGSDKDLSSNTITITVTK